MCCLLLCKTSWFHFPPLLSAYYFPSIHPENSFVSSRGRDHATNTLSNKIHIKWDSLSLFQTLRHIYPKCQVKERKAVVAFEVQWERSSNARALQGLALPMQVLFLSFFFQTRDGEKALAIGVLTRVAPTTTATLPAHEYFFVHFAPDPHGRSLLYYCKCINGKKVGRICDDLQSARDSGNDTISHAFWP